MYMVGAQVGFFQGDVRNLMSDLKELQPTVFPCVPRLLNRLYDKVTGLCDILTVLYDKVTGLCDMATGLCDKVT